MRQVLFHLPFTDGLVPPDGLPLYGFGAMLFLCFVLTAMLWGPLRTARVGVSRERLQDMAIVIFLTGIAGARVVYMWQYHQDFRAETTAGLVMSFFEIWNGGIVIYGGVIGATLGYVAFYYLVLKKYRINTWKLADAVAPLIALGLAVGRIGCYLNGCCWGQVACEECQVVPLAAELGQFPLLPAHARGQVVRPPAPDDRMPAIHGLQTSTGFTTAGFSGSGGKLLMTAELPDPRVVVAVERGSAAEAAGLKPGDRIVAFNGKKNDIVVTPRGDDDRLLKLAELAKNQKGEPIFREDERKQRHLVHIVFAGITDVQAMATPNTPGLSQADGLSVTDTLWEAVRDWPRGRSELVLDVQRGGETLTLAFAPRTVTFFPTQLYETVSMLLLIGLLLSFQPFRRHDGQVMVLLMLGYACHRFLNEAIRIEPTYQFGLTLSQWISLGIVGAAVVLEVYLRATQPKLPAGMQPLGPPPAVTGVPGTSP